MNEHKTTLADLGLGAGYLIWAFRAAAIDHSDCVVLQRGYEHLLAEDSADAVALINALSKAFNKQGRRMLSIASIDRAGVTTDELSIIGLISAAQRHDAELLGAHTAWLTAGGSQNEIERLSAQVASVFSKHRIFIDSPAIEISAPIKPTSFAGLHSVGHA